jgi:hypothetical protein
MKPVLNKKTTKFDVGDFITSTWNSRRRIYRIVALAPCSTLRVCTTCDSGNIAYSVRAYKKRLGRNQWNVCGSSSNPEFARINPITMEVEGEDS